MGGLFSKPKVSATPAPVEVPVYTPIEEAVETEPVVTAPTTSDEDIQKKRARQMERLSATSGRASTFLTSSESGLG